MPGRAFNILLVEDDEIEAEAIRRSFRKYHLPNTITVAADGLAALELLNGTGSGGAPYRPNLILLDLNMPRMSGLEFLDVLRQDPLLRRNIVFILTTSNREEDKVAAYDRQVAGYLVKSQLGDDFLRLTQLLDTYWQVIEFPPEAAYGQLLSHQPLIG
jgi:CheY-like chemotaxis protein